MSPSPPMRSTPRSIRTTIPAYSAHHGNITQMDDAFGRLMKKLDDPACARTRSCFSRATTAPRSPHSIRTAPPDRCATRRERCGRVASACRASCAGLERPSPARRSDEPICGVDFLPTICAVAGLQAPQDRALDGASWLPVLEGGKVERKTPLYWHFNRATGGPKVAMRVGDWKILADTRPPAAATRQRHHR
jgi:arylsulfatase A